MKFKIFVIIRSIIKFKIFLVLPRRGNENLDIIMDILVSFLLDTCIYRYADHGEISLTNPSVSLTIQIHEERVFSQLSFKSFVSCF